MRPQPDTPPETTDGHVSTPREDAPGDEASLLALREERDRIYDQLLRSQADFQNYQRRAKAQADLDRQYAVTDLARDLLDVLDNCERGAEASRASGAAGIVEGFEMVHRQLLGVLAKYGVEPIEALGRPFDPNLHEAVARRPADAEHPEGTVAAVLNRGYKIRDRVLRPTKVAVAADLA